MNFTLLMRKTFVYFTSESRKKPAVKFSSNKERLNLASKKKKVYVCQHKQLFLMFW